MISSCKDGVQWDCSEDDRGCAFGPNHFSHLLVGICATKTLLLILKDLFIVLEPIKITLPGFLTRLVHWSSRKIEFPASIGCQQNDWYRWLQHRETIWSPAQSIRSQSEKSHNTHSLYHQMHCTSPYQIVIHYVAMNVSGESAAEYLVKHRRMLA